MKKIYVVREVIEVRKKYLIEADDQADAIEQVKNKKEILEPYEEARELQSIIIMEEKRPY